MNIKTRPSKRRLLVAYIVLFATAVVTENARAVPVNGSIGFAGAGTLTQGGGTSTVTFNNPQQVNLRIGDYQNLPVGTPANFAPISWTGSGASTMLTSNNSPEWTIVFGGTTYQFSIISLSSAVADATAGVFSVLGTGIATINGAINREPTFASFRLDGVGGQVTFTGVNNADCAPGCIVPSVPEGGSGIALLSVGAIACELLRRTMARQTR